MLLCRYIGKESPDAVMGEICWRIKHLLQGPSLGIHDQQTQNEEADEESFLESGESDEESG